jgi:hypothetical protein
MSPGTEKQIYLNSQDEVHRQAAMVSKAFGDALREARENLRKAQEEKEKPQDSCCPCPDSCGDSYGDEYGDEYGDGESAEVQLSPSITQRILESSTELNIKAGELVDILLGQGLREIEATGSFTIIGFNVDECE